LLREPEKHTSKVGLSTAFLNHIAVLRYYAKSRSLIYIFPWATFVSVLIASNGYPDPLTAAMAVGSSYLIMLAVYSYNDVVDLNVDRINAPNRPLVSGRVNRKELTRLIWILNGSGLALATMINLQTLAIASAVLLLGIVYSHPRTHYGDIFPLKTLLTATGAALVSLMGGLAVGNLSPYIIYAALVFFTFECVLASLGDIHDVKGDKTVGRRTFPIVIGLRSTIAMMMMICASIALTTVMISGIININNIGLMMIIAVCSIAIARLRGLFYNHDNRPYVKNTRHVMRFVHVFLQLAVFVGMIL
jgi:geranylgeranylglycerol-phosphate geranylgeranyltransferase